MFVGLSNEFTSPGFALVSKITLALDEAVLPLRLICVFTPAAVAFTTFKTTSPDFWSSDPLA
jgi:hypothetical protein